MPDLSVLVITWNAREALAACLAAVTAACAPRSFELVVAVNGSTDGTLEMLGAKFPDARVIANGRNLGVAPARRAARRKRCQEPFVQSTRRAVPAKGS